MTKKSPFAREDVMEEYLDSLLKDVEDPAEATARAAKLLEKAVADVAQTHDEMEVVEPDVEQLNEQISVEQAQPEQANMAPPAAPTVTLSQSLDESFQALFFEVAGLTLAVPLITLGGIHHLDKVGPLFGKPAWFKGVMLHRDEKVNVVDTALWVMPEKYDQNLVNKLNYQYLIMLGESPWGLCCDKLVNTVTLNKKDVKWRESAGKRPWLAGMVKERMCALIDVEQMISMLNKGLGSND